MPYIVLLLQRVKTSELPSDRAGLLWLTTCSVVTFAGTDGPAPSSPKNELGVELMYGHRPRALPTLISVIAQAPRHQKRFSRTKGVYAAITERTARCDAGADSGPTGYVCSAGWTR